VIVVSATLAVFVFAALVTARERSPAGIVLFAILALLSLAQLAATFWRRSPRRLR
jgi:hypothetical protein